MTNTTTTAPYHLLNEAKAAWAAFAPQFQAVAAKQDRLDGCLVSGDVYLARRA